MRVKPVFALLQPYRVRRRQCHLLFQQRRSAHHSPLYLQLRLRLGFLACVTGCVTNRLASAPGFLAASPAAFMACYPVAFLGLGLDLLGALLC